MNLPPLAQATIANRQKVVGTNITEVQLIRQNFIPDEFVLKRCSFLEEMPTFLLSNSLQLSLR